MILVLGQIRVEFNPVGGMSSQPDFAGRQPSTPSVPHRGSNDWKKIYTRELVDLPSGPGDPARQLQPTPATDHDGTTHLAAFTQPSANRRPRPGQYFQK
jgi:hypothetical protein